MVAKAIKRKKKYCSELVCYYQYNLFLNLRFRNPEKKYYTHPEVRN